MTLHPYAEKQSSRAAWPNGVSSLGLYEKRTHEEWQKV